MAQDTCTEVNHTSVAFLDPVKHGAACSAGLYPSHYLQLTLPILRWTRRAPTLEKKTRVFSD